MAKSKKPDLRIGIISDPHLGFLGHYNPNYYGCGEGPFGKQELWYEYALRYFKWRGVDAVVIPGDMSNACGYCDIDDPNLDKKGVPLYKWWNDEEKTYETGALASPEEVIESGRIFRKVFAGTDTQIFCIYGNHDRPAQALEMENGGNRNVWQEAFGEPYSRVPMKKIKGFTFIGGHWDYEGECKDALDKACAENPNKPVFYVQHPVIMDTTMDSYTGAHRFETGRELVKDHENVIALIGHTHCPITDERTIWQSAKEGDSKCTVISCSTLNYADSTGDLVRGENLWTKHGLILDVNGDDIRVERLSFYTPEMLAVAKGEKKKANPKKCVKSCGADWNFTLKGKEMDWEKRSQNAVAPEFPKGATAGLARGTNFVEVHFPAAIPLDAENDLLHDYYAEAIEEETGEVVSSNQVVTEYHVDHTSDFFSPYYQITLWNLKPDTKYEIRVYARDCWQKKSTKPIVVKSCFAKTPKEDKGKLK